MKAIENLMQKRGKFDYILLETTGLADPGSSHCVCFFLTITIHLFLRSVYLHSSYFTVQNVL